MKVATRIGPPAPSGWPAHHAATVKEQPLPPITQATTADSFVSNKSNPVRVTQSCRAHCPRKSNWIRFIAHERVSRRSLGYWRQWLLLDGGGAVSRLFRRCRRAYPRRDLHRVAPNN